MEKTAVCVAAALLLLPALLPAAGAAGRGDALFEGFRDPPAACRPFVRWWWNGNRLEEGELKREIGVLRAAGFGGVEINPVALPGEARKTGPEPAVWMSDRWIGLLAAASGELRRNGMGAEMIVGSGWPFGGEFLTEDQTIQRIRPVQKRFRGGEVIRLAPFELCDPRKKERLLFLRLVPDGARGTGDVVDLLPAFEKNPALEYPVPAAGGRGFTLAAGVHRRNYAAVGLGTPGAAGPVMDHFRREVTRAYLGRLDRIRERTGRPLSELLDALFCDSIELSGANWTDGFAEKFRAAYPYRLEPYYPFVFRPGGEGGPGAGLSEAFADEAARACHDYHCLLVRVFLENFTSVFHAFCRERGLKSRYQAYGCPLHMGLMEGYLIPDVPEANNWLRSPFSDLSREAYDWDPRRGDKVWNLYAAAAARRRGKKVVSCEAMTCTDAPFEISLAAVKAHDDMNFISGINHSVLHGFNYSPPAAGFPGWVRFGTYFSEQNPWWPHIGRWTAYNARLSRLFQESRPVREWAVLPPEGDCRSEHGLAREPFQTRPWYCFRLWESLSEAGSSAEYVNEALIREGLPYAGVLLCDVRSIAPGTAAALERYVKGGGRLVCIGRVPSRSLSMADGRAGDEAVRAAFARIRAGGGPGRFLLEPAPADRAALLPWTAALLEKAGARPGIALDKPCPGVYQTRSDAGGGRDVFFFVNALRRREASFRAAFPTGGKTPWIWDPEEGGRRPAPVAGARNELSIRLGPLESLLVVFEPPGGPAPAAPAPRIGVAAPRRLSLKGAPGRPLRPAAPWKARFLRVDGRREERQFTGLPDFNASDDPFVKTFAGVVEYETAFDADGTETDLVTGDAHNGITEVSVNGKPAGVCWYGEPRFDVKGLTRPGRNTLSIRHTTVLGNYCLSLKDNPAARRWTRGRGPAPCGITGTPRIYAARGRE